MSQLLSEADFHRRHILSSKVGHLAEKVKKNYIFFGGGGSIQRKIKGVMESFVTNSTYHLRHFAVIWLWAVYTLRQVKGNS